VLFDQPHVVKGAQPRLQVAGVADRCATEGGDFFAAVPAGGDAYILAQILHDWDDERCRVILGNCRRAMRPAGKLLVVEQVLLPANEPSVGKWLDLHMLVLVTGRERTESKYRDLLGGVRLQADQGNFHVLGREHRRRCPRVSPSEMTAGVTADCSGREHWSARAAGSA
jgi:hypothetical protein